MALVQHVTNLIASIPGPDDTPARQLATMEQQLQALLNTNKRPSVAPESRFVFAP